MPKPNMVNANEIVGLGEIADVTGETKSTVSMWASGRYDNGFPAPVAELRSGRLWLKSEVLAWYLTYTPNRGVRNPPVSV